MSFLRFFQRFHESNCKCDVSVKNTLAFVSAHPLTQACSIPNEEDEHPLLINLHQKGKPGIDKLSFSSSSSENTNNAFGKYFVYGERTIDIFYSQLYLVLTLRFDDFLKNLLYVFQYSCRLKRVLERPFSDIDLIRNNSVKMGRQQWKQPRICRHERPSRSLANERVSSIRLALYSQEYVQE